MQNEIRVLFLGDVIGKPGRKAVETYLKTVDADFKIVNGENTAGGMGITPKVAQEVLSFGVDTITTGNHVWRKKDIIPFLMEDRRIVRPLNYPPGTPGFGYNTIKKNDKVLCVVNIEGRVFMDHPDCPFRAMNEFIERMDRKVPLIVDFHAEATSEKVAMGWHLDGKVTAVLGTHTHIQTADEKILPKGTGYITDVGMTGSVDSVIGMDKAAVLERFITLIPQKYEVGKGELEVQGVILTIDGSTGKCLSIERIREAVQA